MLAVSMPNFATSFGIGRDGDKMPGHRAVRRPAFASTHSRAVWALVSVSSVVNVFEQMMNSVSSGFRSRVASTKSVPSTFETKRKVMSRRL